MTGGGGVLAVDFGTSHTVAVVGSGTGPPEPLLFDGSPLLPSAVWVGPDVVATGRDARHFADSRPDGYEPHPKSRVDEELVLLGGTEVATVDLIAALLARVLAEAVRVTGGRPATTVLTVPAAWGAPRRAVLTAAADRAGFAPPVLLPEPVAAGAYHRFPGRTVLVYDFGGGTFDVSVLRSTPDGPRVLATEGLPDAGGADIDEAVVGYLAAAYGPRHPDVWRRLEHPVTADDRHARRALWESARAAKEMLSRAATSYIHVPLLDIEAPLGREQFERLAQPVLNRTVRACRSALAAGGVSPSELDAVLLVGGSSRIPLAATLLHRAFGVAPTTVEQPELTVAEGAVRVVAAAPVAAASSDVGRATAAPDAPAPASAGGRRRWGRPVAVAAALLLVAGLGVATYVFIPAGGDGRPDVAPDRSVPPSSASSSVPVHPSAVMRLFLARWLHRTTRCEPVGDQFPFAGKTTPGTLIEAVRCTPVNTAGTGSYVLGARFTGAEARAAFLTAHGLKDVGGVQELTPTTALAIVWKFSSADAGLCVGWFQGRPGSFDDDVRKQFAEVMR